MRWSGRQWVAWSALPAAVIVLVVLLVFWISGSHPQRYWAIQREWFLGLNAALSRFPAPIWSNLTLLGDGGVLLLALSPLILRRPQAWAAMIGAVPFAMLLSLLPKQYFAMPRPADVIDVQQFTVIGQAITTHNSLPSGHALTVFAGVIAVLATLLARPRGIRQWGGLIAAVSGATILGLARVAVGAHWPLDVAAGAALGWIAGLAGATLARRYPDWWRFWHDTPARYLLGVLLFVSSLWHLHPLPRYPADAPVLWLAVLGGATTAICLFRPARPGSP